jgi:hypothetical protein
MEWWKELWLNEGFATFVGTQAVANFFPEWDVWKQFISDYIFRAFKVCITTANANPFRLIRCVIRIQSKWMSVKQETSTRFSMQSLIAKELALFVWFLITLGRRASERASTST